MTLEDCGAVRVVASFGLGFLLAVLWFDLMFDTQVRGTGGQVATGALNSIAGYYRRVTTTSRPMSRLVSSVMLLTLAALIGEVVLGDSPRWAAIASVSFTGLAIGIAAARTVRAAVRLGEQTDSVERQSALARSIYGDHRVCFVAIAAAVVVQILFA